MQFLKKAVSRIWNSKTTEPAPPDDLFAAAERGDKNWIASLIQQGIDPNTRRSDGVTALILAVRENRVEAIDALLKGGADPNLPSSEGWYAYHFAKNSKQTEAAARLLAAHNGVEPNLTSPLTISPRLIRHSSPSPTRYTRPKRSRANRSSTSAPVNGGTRIGPTLTMSLTTTITTKA